MQVKIEEKMKKLKISETQTFLYHRQIKQTLLLSLLTALLLSFVHCASDDEAPTDDSSDPSPDLALISSSLASSSVNTDASFNFSTTLSNLGAASSASANLRYYQSMDATIDTSDTEVGNPRSIFAIDVQGEEEITINLRAPSSSGTYYYGACVDVLAEETNTSNNCSNGVMLNVSTAPDIVVLGLAGEIITSDDNGVNWTDRSSGTSNYIGALKSGNRLIAVGNGGKIISSDDSGISWTSQTSGTTTSLESITVSGSSLIVVGNYGKVITSDDNGISWTTQNSNIYADTLYGLAASASIVIVVGQNGNIISSDDNGLSWTSQTSGTTASLASITVSGSRWIAVGASGTILTSDDNGVSWTSRNSGTSIHLYDIMISETRLIAVGASGTLLSSDDNGVSWTSRNSGTSRHLYSVAVSASRVIAVGPNGTIITSDDNGVSWTSQTSGSSGFLRQIVVIN